MTVTASVLLLTTIFIWRLIVTSSSQYNRCPDSCSSCGQFLHCYKNNWTVIPETLTQLAAERETSLVVIRNTMITSPGTGFANLSSLLELTLSRNQLKTVDKESFVGLWKLTLLDLSANSLRTLDSQTFDDLVSLEELLVSGNLLSEIEGSPFVGLSSLTKLDLSGNYLKIIATAGFKGLAKLEDLSLQNNDLTYIDRRWFENTGSLSYLSLSHNQIQELPEYAFTHLRNLTVLELNNCQVTTTDSTTFHGLQRLHTLELSGNSFSRFPIIRATDVPRLTYFTIGGGFRQIRENSMKNFRLLEVITIEKCRHLTHINSKSFVNLPSLKTVQVENNRHLSRLESTAFFNVSTPSDVILRDNQLHTLSASLFHWDDVTTIILEDEHWHCDCRLKWLRDINQGSLIKCSSPRSLSGLFLDQVTNLTCDKVEVIVTETSGPPTVGYKTDWGLTPYQIGLIVGVCTVLVLTLIVTTLVLKDGTPGTRTTRGRPIDHHHNDD